MRGPLVIIEHCTRPSTAGGAGSDSSPAKYWGTAQCCIRRLLQEPLLQALGVRCLVNPKAAAPTEGPSLHP